VVAVSSSKMLVPTSQITCYHDPQGPQYECELVDKDLATSCFQKKRKEDVHICKFGETVSRSSDKN